MKTALLKSLEYHHLGVMPQNLFNIELIGMLNDAIEHITPGYTKHLVKCKYFLLSIRMPAILHTCFSYNFLYWSP